MEGPIKTTGVAFAKYKQILSVLVLNVRERWLKIIAGNSNALALEWDNRRTNIRGRALLEIVAELEMVLANVGTSYSFTERVLMCIMDIICDYANAALASRVS